MPNQSQASSEELTSAPSLTLTEEILRDTGKDLFKGSTEVVSGSANFMVGVVTGYFVTYWAIMKFLGFEVLFKAGMPLPTLFAGLAIFPPILLVASLLFYLWAVSPIRFQFNPDDLTSVKQARDLLLDERRYRMRFGAIFLVLALLLTIVVAIATLLVTPAT